jgi:uncharacterized protein YjbI with pentapeptide repeats
LAKCSYTITYYDRDLGREESYNCPDEEHSEGLCKFHLKGYSADEKNQEELIELLKQKIVYANASESSLKWIGYQIPPEFALMHEFKVNVYADAANFIGNVSFSRSIFNKTVSFSNATFNQEADFSTAMFNIEAYFSNATFNQEADFSNTTFNRKANFLGTTFNRGANFYNATFNQEANFLGTIFNRQI